jgi:arylsulfatase
MIETDRGLSTKAVTIAELFKSAGYRTAIFGKWHLGDLPKFDPSQQGFDESLFIKKSNNQTDELWLGKRLVEKPFDNRQLTQRFTDAAVTFVKEQKSKPFLMYVPYSAPHFPVQPHPQWEGKSAYGVYGDVVEEMDSRIGEILMALEDTGVAGRTIVVFLSDNGPEPKTQASQASPFRGKKWSALEGGTRVPCIIRWPQVIAAGSKSDELTAALDLLPTLAEACGISESLPKPLDGRSVLGTWKGDDGTDHARNELLYWHGSKGFQAIRVGEWKLFPDRKNAKLPGKKKGGGPALFHLKSDPAETKDVSESHPDLVRAMLKTAEEQLASLNRSRIELAK